MPAPRYYNNSSCPPSVFSVVGVLHWFKRNKGSVYPSQAQLSRATGLPTRTVKWAIAWMVREKWIAVIRSDHARGHHLPNAYLIFVEDSRKPLKKKVFSRCPSVQGSLSSGVGFDFERLEKPLVLGLRARARGRGYGSEPRPGQGHGVGGYSWGVQRALEFSGAAAFTPLYLRAQRILGDDLLAAAVRDAKDATMAGDVRCRGRYLSWMIKARMAEMN